jgi:creatinine amidohydrolase/Fe(II)-dependent formamide hydrolase-like protein
MGATVLDRLSWPEIQAQRDAGRATVVLALGATEQHGPHLPVATDSLIGDRLAWMVAERLDAFVAPTVRIGCSHHHLAFPGTLSVSPQTFGAVVADLVRSLVRGGFRKVVLLPTHGGNFAPLGAALDELGPVEGIEIKALTDVRVLLALAQLGAEEHGVPLGDGGLHAGEWETSMLLSIHPDLVHPERAEPGYTGDLQAALGSLFENGVDSIASNGVIGDPTSASAENGERYWAKALQIVMDHIQ